MKEGNLRDKYMNETENEEVITEVIKSEYNNLNQARNNKIFDFFKNLRQNIMEKSKKYNLDNIKSWADGNKLYLNSRILIQNPFFNIILDISIHKNNTKADILSDLENNSQLDNYDKILYNI